MKMEEALKESEPRTGSASGMDTHVPLVPAKAIAAGAHYSLVLADDGTVWTWGRNECGQLGDGTIAERAAPAQVGGLTGVTAIAAGAGHVIALAQDGVVWTWGDNASGQLGDGTTANRSAPVQVGGLTGVTAVAAGAHHSMALTEDGVVWAWGDNASGQLGDGTTANRSVPAQVGGLTGVTAVAAGAGHAMALAQDGTVWTWGDNVSGQLADGNTVGRSDPAQISWLTGVTVVAAGAHHALALRHDGTIWSWGSNTYGQLGDGTKNGRTVPVPTEDLTEMRAIAGGENHTIALKQDGTVWAWGTNDFGQLGAESTKKPRTKASSVSPFSLAEKGNMNERNIIPVVGIAAGAHHVLALLSDGTVWSWGDNASGQLGDGTVNERADQGPVSGLTGVTAIAAGEYHSMALTRDGAVWTWGDNASGQLGDGTVNERAAPGPVNGLTGVTAIAAGAHHSMALAPDGTVWTWGSNVFGQLGNGTMIERPAVAALNHLLKGQNWSRERLRSFAGKRVVFRLAPLPDLRLLILPSGLVDAASPDASADLTVTVLAGALPRLLARDEAAMAQVDLAGPVDLACTVQLLFRELAWDAEEDLSRIFGDVLAHRIVGTARDVLTWQKDAAIRLAQNFAEYLTHEQPLLTSGIDATALRRSLEALNEDCSRLERRLEQLETRTRQKRQKRGSE